MTPKHVEVILWVVLCMARRKRFRHKKRVDTQAAEAREIQRFQEQVLEKSGNLSLHLIMTFGIWIECFGNDH